MSTPAIVAVSFIAGIMFYDYLLLGMYFIRSNGGIRTPQWWINWKQKRAEKKARKQEQKNLKKWLKLCEYYDIPKSY